MTVMRSLIDVRIFSLTDSNSFEQLALEIFRFQAAGCSVYREYLGLLDVEPNRVDTLFSIPFMPVSFFRDHTNHDRGMGA